MRYVIVEWTDKGYVVVHWNHSFVDVEKHYLRLKKTNPNIHLMVDAFKSREEEQKAKLREFFENAKVR